MLTITVSPDHKQMRDNCAAAYGTAFQRHEAMSSPIQFTRVFMAAERGFAKACRTQKDTR